MTQQLLTFSTGLEAAIDAIHVATAIYTAPPEVEALLDRLGWPERGTRLLDPGAGDGGFVIAALARIALARDDVETAAFRVRGYEFHAGAATAARNRVAAHLIGRGWTAAASRAAAARIIEERDFLLSPVPVGEFDVVAQNPPYLRCVALPGEYKAEFVQAMPRHVHGDLLHAFLQRAADVVAPGGVVGCVTSDRWLLNDGSAELRRRIGERFTVRDLRRLDSGSAFYRPKTRRKGSPPRLHPVTLVLDTAGKGERLTGAPFPLNPAPQIDGIPLGELVKVQLAPWMGPEGIFVVRDPSPFPSEHLAPCVEPDDIHPTDDRLTGHSRWALITNPAQEPPPSVLAHLDATLHRMPSRGRRKIRWLPPETFAHRLPHPSDAVLVPRIAKRLRAVLLPAGTLPVNHNLVVIGGVDVATLQTWLSHPDVQEQATSLSLPLENGYRSFTATMLRKLIIPRELISAGVAK